MTANLPAASSPTRSPLASIPTSLMSLLSDGEANDHWDAANVKLPPAIAEKLPDAKKAADAAVAGAGDAIRSCSRMLAIVCAKVAPTLSKPQVDAWVSATLTALSDLPADLVKIGLDKAVHTAMQFPSEIEGVVRAAIGEELMRRHRVRNRLIALDRLLAKPEPVKAGTCPGDEASKIVDNMLKTIAAKRAARGELPSGERVAEARPEIDWNAENMKRVADSNFFRAMRGLPPQTLEEWQAAQKASLSRIIPQPVEVDDFDPFEGQA